MFYIESNYQMTNQLYVNTFVIENDVDKYIKKPNPTPKGTEKNTDVKQLYKGK